jgi:hypothetical protein
MHRVRSSWHMFERVTPVVSHRNIALAGNASSRLLPPR